MIIKHLCYSILVWNASYIGLGERDGEDGHNEKVKETLVTIERKKKYSRKELRKFEIEKNKKFLADECSKKDVIRTHSNKQAYGSGFHLEPHNAEKKKTILRSDIPNFTSDDGIRIQILRILICLWTVNLTLSSK